MGCTDWQTDSVVAVQLWVAELMHWLSFSMLLLAGVNVVVEGDWRFCHH